MPLVRTKSYNHFCHQCLMIREDNMRALTVSSPARQSDAVDEMLEEAEGVFAGEIVRCCQ